MTNQPVVSARAEASRRNGARSRGPATADGRQRSAQNALRHGLRAQRFVLLDDEDRAGFQAVEEALRAELAPEGALQSLLLTRVALAAWRMFRADRIEVELLDPRVGGAAGPGLALIRDGHGPRAFDTLLRYRGAVQAEFWRALRALYALKDGDPLPATLAAGAVALPQARPGRPAEPVPLADQRSPNASELKPQARGPAAGQNPNEPESRRNTGDSTRRCTPERPAEPPAATPEAGVMDLPAMPGSSPTTTAEPRPGREPCGEVSVPKTPRWLPRMLGLARRP